MSDQRFPQVAIAPSPAFQRKVVSRRHWWLWLFGTVLAFAIVAAGYLFVTQASDRAAIARLHAEFDSDDPNWRWSDRQREQPAIPDEKNLTQLCIRINAAMPRGPKFPGPGFVPSEETLKLRDIGPNIALSLPQLASLHEHAGIYRKSLDLCKEIRKMPGFRSGTADDPVTAFMAPFVGPDELFPAVLLDRHVLLQIDEQDHAAAVETLHQMLHYLSLTRTDRSRYGPSIRQGVRESIVRNTIRLLGHCVVSDGALAGLQSEIERESEVDGFRHKLVMERSYLEEIFAALEAGRLSEDSVRKLFGVKGPTTPSLSDVNRLRTYLDMQVETKALLELCGLPYAEQTERISKFRSLRAGRVGVESGHPMTWLVMTNSPAPLTAHINSRTVETRLKATVAALAAERFRLKHDRWPGDWRQLIDAKFIDKAPVDSQRGLPLKMLAAPNGLAIFSSSREVPADAEVHWTADGLPSQADTGVRLWDPQHRRLSPE